MEKIILEELNDSQLLEIVDELQKGTFAKDSIARKLAIQFFDGDSLSQIFAIPHLILPIVAARLRGCSPHIEK